jgi:hypothetical protein
VPAAGLLATNRRVRMSFMETFKKVVFVKGFKRLFVSVSAHEDVIHGDLMVSSCYTIVSVKEFASVSLRVCRRERMSFMVT